MSESKERTFVGRIADAHIGDVRTLALSYLNRLDEIADLEAALAEAQAVITKLPHTKDGVPITVGMDVWGAWQDVGIVEQIHSNHVVMRQPGGLFWRLGSECYSTPEAAIAAARGEEAKR